MYGIFTYIYYKKSTIHVGKYTLYMDPSWDKKPAEIACLFHQTAAPSLISPGKGTKFDRAVILNDVWWPGRWDTGPWRYTPEN